MSRRDGAERQVERLAGEPRHLGLVGDLERGIDAGLERKLAQQAEAERVDRRDLDVGDALAQRAPDVAARARRGRRAARSSASTRSRISAAALRVNVIARMWRGSTPASISADVPVDEHARLARAGRRLEHDVVGADRRRSPARPDRAAAFGVRRARQTDSAASSSSSRYSLRQTPAYRHHGTSPVLRGFGGNSPASMCSIDVGELRRRGRSRPRRPARRPPAAPSNLRSSPNARYIAERPVRPLVARLEQLPRAVRVDGDLHGRLQVRHLAELVVDDAKRAVVEHVDAIGLAADLDRRVWTRPPRREKRNGPRSATRPGDRRSCRPRRPRARRRARPCRGARSSRAGASLRARDRPQAARRARRRRSCVNSASASGSVGGRDGAAALALPRAIEPLEERVDERCRARAASGPTPPRAPRAGRARSRRST